jgi:translocation and assembly module TamB
MGGTLKKPELSFLLNDESIDEVEAISLIVFGKTMEQLTGGEEDAVLSSTLESTGTAMLTGQVSAQLSNFVQNKLNVDLFEIKSDDLWQQTSLSLGTYIGNNFFVSYEKAFDISDFKALNSDKINVEYQIHKNIFLNTTQGTTNENGLDIIFKWQKNESSTSRY